MAKPSEDSKKKVPRGCEIKPCFCKHEFQDKKYGKNMRVKNLSTKGPRCTVCQHEG